MISAVSAAGVVNANVVYEPYGSVMESVQPAGAAGTAVGMPAHRRRMNDKYVDEIGGLAYYGARYYDNVMIGWTQGDPMYRFAPDESRDDPRRSNLYMFVKSNPLSYDDPDGMDSRSMGVVDCANTHGEWWKMVAASMFWRPPPEAESSSTDEGCGFLCSLIPGGDAFYKAKSGDGWGALRSAATDLAVGAALKYGGKLLGKLWGEGKAARSVRKTGCFAAGTLVLTREGAVRIEDVQIGDFVWAKDELTSEVALRSVTSRFVLDDQPVFELTVEGPSKETERITATYEHPFWAENGWVAAQDLVSGQQIRTISGEWAILVSRTRLPQRARVYEFHTFFVGKQGIWVHNSSKVGGALAKRGAAINRRMQGFEHLADVTARDAIMSRGGVGSNVQKIGHWAQKTVAEVAAGVVDGAKGADTAWKLIRKAAKYGDEY
jgi:RHS repeat-associated protein